MHHGCEFGQFIRKRQGQGSHDDRRARHSHYDVSRFNFGGIECLSDGLTKQRRIGTIRWLPKIERLSRGSTYSRTAFSAVSVRDSQRLTIEVNSGDSTGSAVAVL